MDSQGVRFTADRAVANFAATGFNDLASSAIVRGGSWEVCSDARFGGKCVALRPGSYLSLRAMGMNDRVSSVRELDRTGSAERYRRDDSYARNDDDDRYIYRDGWTYDREENRWERN